MVIRQPGYQREFRCIGGDCPDTCCRDWEIVVDRRALADYRAASGPLGERLARSLRVGEDGQVCFALGQDGRCAMLTPEGLCAIQRDWGEEHLCGHCAAYPRFTEEYGCLTETALAASCPEAARLLLEGEAFSLEEVDDGGAQPPFEGVDGALLAALEDTRPRVLALLGRGEVPVWGRLAGMLELADRGQRLVDRGDYGALGRLEPQPGPGRPGDGLRAVAAALMAACAGLEPLRPDWPEELARGAQRLEEMAPEGYRAARRGFEQAARGWEGGLARVACYLVFRHWHKTVNDDLLYGRAALVGAGCTLLYHLRLLRWMETGQADRAGEIALLGAFSREVEHLQDNLDCLVEGLSDAGRWPLQAAFGG